MTIKNIAYVFEVARMDKGIKTGRFVMKYSEYPKYSKMYESLTEAEKNEIIKQVKARTRTKTS
jgi:hypothetical protein